AARVPDAEVTRILFTGLKEAGRPGTLGGLLLTLVACVVSVGVLRSARIGAGAKGVEGRTAIA
ncbi:MAG TPA: hypothetical protein VM694_10565, partial [Polyangium sp.]|nr:hypothetical protein [Polyangium sp.]